MSAYQQGQPTALIQTESLNTLCMSSEQSLVHLTCFPQMVLRTLLWETNTNFGSQGLTSSYLEQTVVLLYMIDSYSQTCGEETSMKYSCNFCWATEHDLHNDRQQIMVRPRSIQCRTQHMPPCIKKRCGKQHLAFQKHKLRLTLTGNHSHHSPNSIQSIGHGLGCEQTS